MDEPRWPNVHYEPVDYQSISYFAGPKKKEGPKSLDEVDPKLLETYDKLGIPLHEQEALAGVAVDAVGNAFVGGYVSDNVFKITPGGTVTEIIDALGGTIRVESTLGEGSTFCVSLPRARG